ncbi:hypothetical protein Pan216_13400 [Planctomycetes bacterium Pan216]|uniref:Poly-gamma-glutamate system protein n=1 Tax=Kolteria novifilia TaxID=2527975 RepID=A0A518B0I4_9BACT|nr:hypothetical protein Pan216_13400 [Planctomycetes bacterium Pan216]
MTYLRRTMLRTAVLTSAFLVMPTPRAFAGAPRAIASAEFTQAAEHAVELMKAVKQLRLERGYPINLELDPTGSGLIGAADTALTSMRGNLVSKRSSANPNFAAAVVSMLKQAGVKEGDTIAVGWTGSLPAFNLCVAASIETLDLNPVCVASTSASQYGANFPEMTWLDIERYLHEKELISFRSVAASLGGREDQGLNFNDKSRNMLRAAIERNQLPFLHETTLGDSIRRRMDLIDRHADDHEIKAYINVGGGAASVGRSIGKRSYHPGLNLEASAKALSIDSVMTRFMKRGVPVIHMVSASKLAVNYDFPVPPAAIPAVGEGKLFASSTSRIASARKPVGKQVSKVIETPAPAPEEVDVVAPSVP